MKPKTIPTLTHAERGLSPTYASSTIMGVLSQMDIKSTAIRHLSITPGIKFSQVIKKLDLGNPILSSSKGPAVLENFYQTKSCAFLVGITNSNVRIDSFSENLKAAKEASDLIKKLEKLELKHASRTDGVWVPFTYSTPNGPEMITEFIECPGWEDVEKNYPQEICSDLAKIISLKDPLKFGRLLLFHGDPGTGKTYFLRALMMAWKETYNFTVVTDPERFAAEPSYYFSIASRVKNAITDQQYEEKSEEDNEDVEYESLSVKNRKPAVFIMEDAADLIITESREKHYDKVGKLLNMTDGLFGQGRRDILLMTFNEKVNEIDPAFTRPGRCIANIHFPVFPPKEATEWILNRGGSKIKPKEMTLAEMYARHLRREVVKSENGLASVVGFAGE